MLRLSPAEKRDAVVEEREDEDKVHEGYREVVDNDTSCDDSVDEPVVPFENCEAALCWEEEVVC